MDRDHQRLERDHRRNPKHLAHSDSRIASVNMNAKVVVVLRKGVVPIL